MQVYFRNVFKLFYKTEANLFQIMHYWIQLKSKFYLSCKDKGNQIQNTKCCVSICNLKK